MRLKSRVIRWDARTGFVLEDSDADEFERLFREEGVHRLSREDFGTVGAVLRAGAGTWGSRDARTGVPDGGGRDWVP